VTLSLCPVEGTKVGFITVVGLELALGIVVVGPTAVTGDGFGMASGDVGETGADGGKLIGELVDRIVGGLVGTGEMVGAKVGGGG
jgi:hypothetical protein